MKHTPGPWPIEEEPADEEYWVTRVHYKVGPAKIIYNKADALLISEAPNMIDSLDAFLDIMDAMISDGIELSDGEAAARAQGLAVIARVRGES